MTKSNLALLEIGTEEIPARFIPDALRQLSAQFETKLKESGVPFSKIDVWGTPRRLTAMISGIGPKSESRTDVVIGPPPKAAKNPDGNWTQAATGFAKAQNVKVEALQLQNTPKGERYVALQHVKGQRTDALLKDLFPAIIKGLSFPKSMIWAGQDFRFARPIRWIVGLYNSKVIRFRLSDVTSDKATYGLLSLGGAKIVVSRPEKYKSVLQGRCILVDPEERKKNIRHQLDLIAKRLKASPVVSDDHLTEVVHLTEYPVSIVGHFPDAYLKLPREILVSVLKKHQKFFPLESSKGHLLNSFVGVRNGPSESQEEVREGYERVVNARFSDAKFFYEKDAATRLEELVPKLAGVGFHEKLGSVLDKTSRVRRLTAAFAERIGLNSQAAQHADRAAYLSKADLLTQMVGEFPELQGIAGRFYGEQQEPREVAQAIEQHYWPLTADGPLPKTPEAAVVAVADKMDTLAANFSVGLMPSGSADPYGLRRACMGVVRILLNEKWNVTIDAVIALAGQTLATAPSPKVADDLRDFIKQRFLTLMASDGYRDDEVDAVFALKNQSLTLMHEKLKGLKGVRGKPEFDSLSNALKRTGNLLKQAGTVSFDGVAFDVGVLGEPEQKLFSALEEVKGNIDKAVTDHKFREALELLARLKEPVDRFFVEVMVMVDDAQLRRQRLALLAQVKGVFESIADFSKLQVNGAGTRS